MHILITGHTGFKGSWLTLMLTQLGHKVSGLSLKPQRGSHYQLARINEIIHQEYLLDIRNAKAVRDSLAIANPDFIFHLAAQPFVKEGFRKPDYTFQVNVQGTLNVLKATTVLPKLKGLLVITTDKVYDNLSRSKRAFCESDPLGYSDPYSTSKAMADLLSQSWVKNITRIPIGIARAGNVIGGGDFGMDRLIPDLVRDSVEKKITQIRNPDATRPWQYVLDCLYGYLLHMEYTLKGNSDIFNFGPNPKNHYKVKTVANSFLTLLDQGGWSYDSSPHDPETETLSLDSSKAIKLLNWSNKFDLFQTLESTANWYKTFIQGGNINLKSKRCVTSYLH